MDSILRLCLNPLRYVPRRISPRRRGTDYVIDNATHLSRRRFRKRARRYAEQPCQLAGVTSTTKNCNSSCAGSSLRSQCKGRSQEIFGESACKWLMERGI